MVAILDFPPDPACRAFAFFLNEFMLAQTLIVAFTALNAFLMVVKGRKVGLGKYDWKLLCVAFELPLALNTFFESLKLFGPAGAWYVENVDVI